MKKIIVFIFTCLGFSSYGLALPQLEKVTSSFENSTLTTEYEFSTKVKQSDILVEYINQTIQLNIPGVQVPNGKVVKRVDENNLRSIYSYQLNDDVMRSRIIYNKPVLAKNYEGFVKLKADKNKLFVTVYDPVLAKNKKNDESNNFVVRPPVDLENVLGNSSEEPMTAEEIVKQELKTRMNVKPVDEKKKAKKEVAKATAEEKTEKLELKESEIPLFTAKKNEADEQVESSMSRMLVSLGIVGLLAGGIIVFARWWSKKHKINTDETQIKVVNQHFIGPKKSLAIVRVAGEFILLGVTDNNINHIKTLSLIDDEFQDDTTLPSTFAKAMDAPVKNEVSQKVVAKEPSTYLGDIKSEISEKLKGMRSI